VPTFPIAAGHLRNNEFRGRVDEQAATEPAQSAAHAAQGALS